jgi:YegS/Rv2252/BmrU family lipid kinase
MQIKSVAILANSKAGSGKAAKIAQKLAKVVTENNIPYTLFIAIWPSAELLETFSDCWVIGGDGTINYFINQYPHCKSCISLFDGGTGNDFAWKLYGNTSLEQKIHLILSTTPKLIDAGKVNDKLYINCLGVGFDGEILQSMKAIRFIGGHYGYLLAVLYKIFSFKETNLHIKCATEHWNEKFLLAMVVNSSRAGGGFNIAPPAEINDGELNMVLCKRMPIWKRLMYLPIIKSGKHLALPFVIHKLGKKFTIQSEKELPIQMDGELFFAKDLEIEVLAKQFLFRY